MELKQYIRTVARRLPRLLAVGEHEFQHLAKIELSHLAPARGPVSGLAQTLATELTLIVAEEPIDSSLVVWRSVALRSGVGCRCAVITGDKARALAITPDLFEEAMQKNVIIGVARQVEEAFEMAMSLLNTGSVDVLGLDFFDCPQLGQIDAGLLNMALPPLGRAAKANNCAVLIPFAGASARSDEMIYNCAARLQVRQTDSVLCK